MTRTLYPATRRLLKNLAIVAIALAVVLIVLGLNLDHILKSRFESSLTKAIGTPVIIQQLHLQPLQGNLQVKELKITNPPGFTVPILMKVHDLQLQTKNFGLMGKTLVVDRLQIIGVDLTIEQRQLRNNLVNLLDQLEQKKRQSQQADRRFQIQQDPDSDHPVRHCAGHFRRLAKPESARIDAVVRIRCARFRRQVFRSAFRRA